MKTLTDIFRDMFSARRKAKEEDRNLSPQPAGKPVSDNQPYSLTQKTIKNETENLEVHQVLDVDNSGNPKIAGKSKEKVGETSASRQSDNSEADNLAAAAQAESTGNTVESVHQPEVVSEEPMEETVEEAYRRGLIDGRNEQIEELYFPKLNDGIPHFRGSPSKCRPVGDIFSMAREA